MSYNTELFYNRFYFKATNYCKFFKLYYKSKIICSHCLDLGIIISKLEVYEIPMEFGGDKCHVDYYILLDSKGYRVVFKFPESILEKLENGQEIMVMKMMEEYFDEKFGI